MNYLLKNRRNPSPLKRRALIASSVAVLFFSLFLIAHPFFSNIFKTSFRPLFIAHGALLEGTDFLSAFFVPRVKLEEENRLLKEQIESLKFDRMANEVLRFENVRLRELLGRTPSAEGMLVAVLSRPPYTPFDTLIVDAGTKNNVEKDASVAYLGAYLGKIIGVDVLTSHVLLASSPGETTQTFVARTGEAVRLEGRGNGNFVALLPKAFDIVKGDILEISSLDNLIVAEVGHIDSDPASSFQAVYLKGPVNMNNLQRVMIFPPLHHE
ncbi:MAG: rod shape-determining protein MreC [Patescibacteria group bacterium]|nr:rod shape-determining protein MreC [bacterium]MDZ4240651.1 rod shape-determining protein MreC [Patescibacteria group bacterium]